MEWSTVGVALIGLAGALIGAAITLANTWLQSSHSHKLMRRTELLDLFSEYASYIERAYKTRRDVQALENEIDDFVAKGEDPGDGRRKRFSEALDARLESISERDVVQYRVHILGSIEIRKIIDVWSDRMPVEDFVLLSYAFMLVARRDTALTKDERRTAEANVKTVLAHPDVKRLLAESKIKA